MGDDEIFKISEYCCCYNWVSHFQLDQKDKPFCIKKNGLHIISFILGDRRRLGGWCSKWKEPKSREVSAHTKINEKWKLDISFFMFDPCHFPKCAGHIAGKLKGGPLEENNMFFNILDKRSHNISEIPK